MHLAGVDVTRMAVAAGREESQEIRIGRVGRLASRSIKDRYGDAPLALELGGTVGEQ